MTAMSQKSDFTSDTRMSQIEHKENRIAYLSVPDISGISKMAASATFTKPERNAECGLLRAYEEAIQPTVADVLHYLLTSKCESKR